MSHSACPYGRRQAVALASMNIRAVTTHWGVDYLARPRKPHGLSLGTGRVGPGFQPRNEGGQFVSYEHLHIRVAATYEMTVWQAGIVDKKVATDVEAYPWGEGCPNWGPAEG